ncbi:MAG: hutC, partial [Proteobacteria bacterium]|nr:hutC [Pseudomonadota bacterium]
EHTVEAVLPAPWEAKLLAIARSDPCLLIRRRTFSGERIVTSVRLLMPGGRSRIESREGASVA